MAVYYKPQSPIQSGEDFIYPITTADQVKVDKDTRLNAVGVYLKNIDNSTDTTVYGNNATTLGGVAAEDYALKTDTAPDSSKLGGKSASEYALKSDTAPDSNKLGGKAPEYYLQPRNLLDNSNFRNLVNQRGITSETSVPAYSYFIDRWVNQTSEARSFTLSTSGIGLPLVTTLLQKIEKIEAGKIVTFAIKLSDGTIATLTGTVQYTSDGSWTRFASISHFFGDMYMETMNGFVNVVVYNTEVITIAWAALYEGSYTADTLPPYVPKEYAAELAECRRYFRRYTAGNASLILSGLVTSGAKDISVNAPELAPMRIKSVSIAYSGSGVIIRGVSGYATECSGSRIYGDISIAPYQNNSSFCATIDINKKDGTAWGLTNNTPVVVSFAANSTLDYVADL